ncbi:MAG: DUF4352 domain-containing protein [Candidatus Saccharibacteria bacterium]
MKKHHNEFNLETEISKETKEIKREWRHLKKFKDENYLLFTAFVILIAGLVIINAVYVIEHGSTYTPSRLVTIDPNVYLTSLQNGSNGAVTAKISDVTENDKIDYAFAADPGSTMLTFNISVTNTTARTQHFIPVNQLYVRSNEGDYAALHASMYVTKPIPSTDLAPDKTVEGQVSFSIPKRVAHPLLYVDTGWNRTTPLVFDVLK